MGTTKSAHQRGLGHAHRKQREHLLRQLTDGTPCWWCNKPLHHHPTNNWDHAPLEADHTLARSQGGTRADRLLHMTCNRERGDGTRDHQRPATTGTPIPTTTDPLGHTALPWP